MVACLSLTTKLYKAAEMSFRYIYTYIQFDFIFPFVTPFPDSSRQKRKKLIQNIFLLFFEIERQGNRNTPNVVMKWQWVYKLCYQQKCTKEKCNHKNIFIRKKGRRFLRQEKE